MSNLATHCDSLSQTLCLSVVWHDATANAFTAWQHCAYEIPKSTNTYYYLMWVRRHSSSHRVVITLSGHAMLKIFCHTSCGLCVFLSLGSCLDRVCLYFNSEVCACVFVCVGSRGGGRNSFKPKQVETGLCRRSELAPCWEVGGCCWLCGLWCNMAFDLTQESPLDQRVCVSDCNLNSKSELPLLKHNFIRWKGKHSERDIL